MFFYISPSGGKYLLCEEQRVILEKGDSPVDFLNGKIEPKKILPNRDQRHSLSERVVGRISPFEDSHTAAVRGVMEEVFSNIDGGIDSDSLRNFLEEKIEPNGSITSTADKSGESNSYRGLRSVYHKQNFVLVLDHNDMDMIFSYPLVDLDEDGEPRALYEFDSAKGYLNIFTWRKVREVKEIDILDENGEPQTRVVTPENSKDVLHEVMVSESKRNSYDYQLRREIVRQSRGKIETYMAYTKDPAILDGGCSTHSELVEYLNNPVNWLSERAELHRKIIDYEFQKVQELSRSLGDQEPTIYMLRGNNGAGKSTLLKSHPRFQRARDVNFEGVINTDYYDSQLRRESVVDNIQTITARQVHVEGGTIEREIRGLAYRMEGLSIVFDKRFSIKAQLEDVFGAVMDTDRKLVIFDLETPVKLSAVRLLTRSTEEDAPKVPFSEIIKGFIGIRSTRGFLIELVKKIDNVEFYVLLDTSSRPPLELASKQIENNTFNVNMHCVREYSEATSLPNKKDLLEIGDETEINDKFIHEIVSYFLPDERAKVDGILREYKRKNLTLKQAVDQAAESYLV